MEEGTVETITEDELWVELATASGASPGKAEDLKKKIMSNEEEE
jgi:hypothetical protein